MSKYQFYETSRHGRRAIDEAEARHNLKSAGYQTTAEQNSIISSLHEQSVAGTRSGTTIYTWREMTQAEVKSAIYPLCLISFEYRFLHRMSSDDLKKLRKKLPEYIRGSQSAEARTLNQQIGNELRSRSAYY